MKRYAYTILIAFFTYTNFFGQYNIELAEALRSKDIKKYEKFLEQLDTSGIEFKSYSWELELLKTGKYNSRKHFEIIKIKPKNYAENVFQHFHNAEYAINLNQQNESFNLFSNALNISLKNNDSILACRSLYNLFQIITRNKRLKSFSEQYIDLYKNMAYNDLEKSYSYYFDFYFNYRKSKEKFQIKNEGIRIANKLRNKYVLMEFYQRIGVVYDVYLKKKDSANYYYKKTISLLDDLGGYNFLIQRKKGVINNLGCIEYERKNYSLALDYFNQAYRIKSSSKRLFNDSIIIDWKVKTHEKNNQLDSALYFSKVKDTISRIIKQEHYAAQIQEQKRKYNNEKLRADNLESETKRIQNKNLVFVAVSLLIIAVCLAILLQKNTSKKRKLAEQTALLEQQKTETLLKDQELLSIDAMISGQEKERQKVANELHDDLGSKMATIKLHVENIKTDKEDPSFRHASKLLEEAYQKIRGISHVKNSGVIAKQGLLPALQGMARTISETNKIQLTVHDFGLENRMENSLELSIFRMVQELVTNIIKHAEASKGCIQLTQHEESLNIMIEDNGKGFDATAISGTDSGIGLRNIEKRIEHLEGSFTIDSALGSGTSIIIDIPI